MSRIEIRNLVKSFRRADGGELLVLDNASFVVGDETFVCLLGPSGSGKSVTLNIIAGLLDQTSGEVLIDSVAMRSKAARYGYVFQQPRLLPWRTVEDNIRFALRADSGRKVPQEENRIRAVLSMVNLTGYERFYPHQISGGMQHRVAIARAYCRDPQLLLMDEPFSSLDEITARKLRAELVDTWMKNKKTVIFVTHDIIEACYLSDKIIVYTPKPTRVAAEIDINLARPREYGSAELYEVEKRVLGVFETSLKEFEQTVALVK
ncbi:MAG: ABC transporter ATP-binding protein [Chloroflexi bacterium]|nr:ABC transporter ATP-binding protein [Chloroflexota bacterium]